MMLLILDAIRQKRVLFRFLTMFYMTIDLSNTNLRLIKLKVSKLYISIEKVFILYLPTRYKVLWLFCLKYFLTIIYPAQASPGYEVGWYTVRDKIVGLHRIWSVDQPISYPLHIFQTSLSHKRLLKTNLETGGIPIKLTDVKNNNLSINIYKLISKV